MELKDSISGAQLASEFEVRSSQVGQWKKQAIRRLPEIYGRSGGADRPPQSTTLCVITFLTHPGGVPLGFFTWVTGAFLFIYRAITPEDRLINRQALLWGGVILAGLILWLAGLSQA